MKQLLIIAVSFFLALSLKAQDKTDSKMDSKMDKQMSHKQKDCVMMKDGKMMEMKDGKTMMMDNDMKMSNGTIVMKDGHHENERWQIYDA